MDWRCVYIYIYISISINNHPKINLFPQKSHMLSNSGSSFVSQQKMCEKNVVYNWQPTASARPQLLQLLWLLDTTLLATSFCHPSEKGTGEPDGRSDLELRNLHRSFKFCKHLRWVCFAVKNQWNFHRARPHLPSARFHISAWILDRQAEYPMNCHWNLMIPQPCEANSWSKSINYRSKVGEKTSQNETSSSKLLGKMRSLFFFLPVSC